jgi:hypothetical protein
VRQLRIREAKVVNNLLSLQCHLSGVVGVNRVDEVRQFRDNGFARHAANTMLYWLN